MSRRAEITREDTSRSARCSWPACPERGVWRFTGSDGAGGDVRGWLCEEHVPDPADGGPVPIVAPPDL